MELRTRAHTHTHRRFPFWVQTDKSLPVTPATRLPIAVNGRGRSHNRRRLRPCTSGHFQLHIDFYYNSFYFICIISFSGLHVLGLERTLHDNRTESNETCNDGPQVNLSADTDRARSFNRDCKKEWQNDQKENRRYHQNSQKTRKSTTRWRNINSSTIPGEERSSV